MNSFTDNLTIIVPVRNRANYLAQTLDSIPAHYKLIVVDNGSTDGTRQVAEDACRQREHAVFLTESEPGAPAARNKGLLACQTEWVYFFDSDDLFTGLPHFEPSRVSDADMLCFPVNVKVDGKERLRTYTTSCDPAKHILMTSFGTQSVIYRTEWLRKIGGWNTAFAMWNDWELGLRALLHSPRLLWYTDQAYHSILVHPDSITGPTMLSRVDIIEQILPLAYDMVAHNRRLRHAMDMRCSILCGTLRREGGAEAASRIRRFITERKLECRLLESFTAHGGHGAWRLAMWFI